LELLIIIQKSDKIGFVAKLEKSEDQTTQKAHNCERLETIEREREGDIEKKNSAKNQATQNLQHMHPKLPAACFHERECAILVPVWHHLYNPLHCGHLDHDSLKRKTPHLPP
jgi:hypothetical protein